MTTVDTPLSATLEAHSPVEFLSYPVVTLDQLQLYAKASGDHNPIHLDESVAKKVGLPGIIAHGMLIAGLMTQRALKFVKEEAELKNFKMTHFQTRFKAMIFLGDTPMIGGSVKSVNENELVLDLQVKNQKGEVTTIGSAKFEHR